MPLFADGLKKIRRNLEQIQNGERPKIVQVAAFSKKQRMDINRLRAEEELAPIEGVIVFRGKHLFDSRCRDDGYQIEQVLQQVEIALSAESVAVCDPNTVLVNPTRRIDSTGHLVEYHAVFECSQQYPFPELWSVIPRGDGRHPHQNE